MIIVRAIINYTLHKIYYVPIIFPEHFTLFSSFSPMNGCGEHRKPYVCKVPSECVLLTCHGHFKDPEGNGEVFSLHYPSARVRLTGKWQSLLLISVWVLTLCAEYVCLSFLPSNMHHLKIVCVQKLLVHTLANLSP